MPDFDKCDYYDCDHNAETLQHEHVEDAIIDFVDQLTCSREDRLVAEIESRGPVTVHGWTRLEVPDESIACWAEAAAETVRECWDEEYGNPNDSSDLQLDLAELTELVRTAVRQSRVWACERTADREFSPDDVIAVIREHRPKWIEEATDG